MKQQDFRSPTTALMISIIAIGLVTLTASQTQADEKRYPGSMCVRWMGSNQIGYNYSAIGNTSSQPNDWLHLDCPIVRDTLGIGIGGSISKGIVRVRDRNGKHGIECSLVAPWRFATSFPEGDIWVWYNSNKTGPAEMGVRDIPFAALTTTSPDVYYFYSCKIPPADEQTGAVSEIVWYSVEERS